MTKSDTDPLFPPPPRQAPGGPITVPPVAGGEDLSGFTGPVPVVVKERAHESAGKEAAEYHAEHAVQPRTEHNTIPNARVVVAEKKPIPPLASGVKIDPPGVTTDPGGARPKGDGSARPRRWRGPLIAIFVLAVFVLGAVFTKLITAPKVNPATSASTLPTTTAPATDSTSTTAMSTSSASGTATAPTSTAVRSATPNVIATAPTAPTSARPTGTTTTTSTTTAPASATTAVPSASASGDPLLIHH
ncbi:hypothetical protein BH09MYX1_BH09MYX1_13370 [soil metagenome]